MNKSIIKNSLYNTLYQLINTLFPLISAMYASRILMPEGIGAVSYAQNIASYFVALAPLGVVSYGVRVIAQHAGDRVAVNTRFWELVTINGISTVLFTVLYYGYLGLTGPFENNTLLLICGINILLNGIDIDWFYQGLEKYGYITLRNLAVKVISLAALFLFVRDKDDLTAYLLISIGATLGNRLLNVLYVRKHIGMQISGFALKQHLIPELTLLLNAFLGSLFSKVDITILGSMGDNFAVGIYTNAMKFVTIIVGLCTAMTSSFLPRLSHYYAVDKKKYAELMNYGVQVVLFLALPAVAGICIIAPKLIPLLFGEAFASAAVTARYLSLLILIKGLGNLVCYQVLISAGLERKQTPIYLCAALANIGMNCLLIPCLGPNGAAIASVATELLLNLLILRISRKIVTIRFLGKNTGKTLLAVLMMTAVLIVLQMICTALSDVVCVTLAVIVGMITYVSMNIVLKNDIIQDVMIQLKGKLTSTLKK